MPRKRMVVDRLLLCGKPPLERSLVTPHTPGDTGEFVGQRDGSDVEAFASFDVECPGAQVIGFVGELAGS